MSTSNSLAKLNSHAHDADQAFIESTHVYFVRGQPEYWLDSDDPDTTLVDVECGPGEGEVSDPEQFHKISKSVTGVWAEVFKANKFDATKTLDQYFDNWKCNDKNKYYQLIRYLQLIHKMNDEQIKNEISTMWTENGTCAAGQGTVMHLQFELYHNGDECDQTIPEFPQFLKFFKADYPHYEAYRTEWSIFDRDVWVAGQIDLVVKDTNTGELVMIDYKRCKDPLDENTNCWGRYGAPPFSQVPDTPWGHYAIQQNIYKWILRKNYGITLSKMFLLQLYCTKDYSVVAMPDLQDVVEEHMASLAKHRADVGYASGSVEAASPESPSKKLKNML